MSSPSLRDPLLLTVLTALAGGCGATGADPKPFKDEGCVLVEEGTLQCEPASDALLGELFLPWKCGFDIIAVSGPGTIKAITGQDGVTREGCCYSVDAVDPDPTSECAIGRPYRERELALTAEVPAPSAASEEGARDPRAALWLAAGAAEHASVAAFARLSLQLMAHGAPIDLVRAAHQAAIDETHHAELCFGLASRYGAGAASPGAFPFTQDVRVTGGLEELAADAAREGCVNETLGAFAAREAMGVARDPEVEATLRTLADDEARHSALSFRVVQWALRVGGEPVRRAVLDALASRREHLDLSELSLRAGVDATLLARAERDGLERVVRPALRALLAA